MQRLQKWNLSWGRLKHFDLLISFLLSASAIALHVLSVSADSSSFMQFVPDRTEHAVLCPMPILTINKEDNPPDHAQPSAVLTYYPITYSNLGGADATGVIITDTFDINVPFERSWPVSLTGDTGNVTYWQTNELRTRDPGNITTAVTVSTSAVSGTVLTNLVQIDSPDAKMANRIETTTVIAENQGCYLYIIPISYTLSISESFEAGVVPPSGWTLIQTNPNETWKIAANGPHSGTYYANVKYDFNQDEVLLSPTFTAVAGHVCLWSFGNLYWCRDTYDNCDLEVWFVNGSWGGSDDVYLGKTDNDWTGTWQWSDSTFDFSSYASGSPARIALRYVGNDGAQIGVDDIIITYSPPPFSFTKSNDPSGPVHEGDVITYTISYANTGLVTQNGVVITDRIPSNTELVSVSSPPTYEIVANSVISWGIGTLDVGETGVVSFQVRVPLLPSLSQSVDMLSSREAYPPAQVLPVPIACDTTRFWAIGVTRQPPEPIPHTIQVQIPPGTSPSEMWLLMKKTDNSPPTVGGQPAQLVMTSTNSFDASLWTAPITPAMVANGEVTVVTHNPRQLNALFLFNEEDPPFDETALDDFAKTTKTFTYTLDMPSVATKTIDVILPFMDITYWTDSSPPEIDTRRTTVTVKFDGQSDTLTVNDPNLGNGLLMTQFPFTIGPFTETITSTKVLTVTVDTEDSVYTLGPRLCRPVYIENTAWLCSDQVGCVSDTVTNIPPDFRPPGRIYLPIILKSSP
jgi:uncharacterized repeat protein (TIGR01451 family)